MPDICEIKRCKREADMTYWHNADKKRICDYHWERHCDDNDKFDLKTAKWKRRKND